MLLLFSIKLTYIGSFFQDGSGQDAKRLKKKSLKRGFFYGEGATYGIALSVIAASVDLHLLLGKIHNDIEASMRNSF